jgi:hypothetical protein
MKTIFKIKSLLLILLVLTSICSCKKKDTEDNQRVLETYYLEEACVEHILGYVLDGEREIVIKESDKYGLLVNINIGAPDFKAFLRGDSLFIPIQGWRTFDGSQATFRGEGEMKNDSLFLHYAAGGAFGIFECECKGGKTKNTHNGKIIYLPNPCQEEPCLPGTVLGLETFSGNYILTINSQWIWNDKIIFDGIEYCEGEYVSITGTISVKSDVFLKKYIELEIRAIK